MKKRVLAVASGGGHWQQLQLLRPAFVSHSALYLTTMPGLPEHHRACPAVIIPDCSGDDKAAIIRCLISIGWQVFRYQPNIVISTGALPGVIALAYGRMIGARTIWVDSAANAERFSKSGRYARRFAHLWLTQWAHVAEEEGGNYAGSVL